MRDDDTPALVVIIAAGYHTRCGSGTMCNRFARAIIRYVDAVGRPFRLDDLCDMHLRVAKARAAAIGLRIQDERTR